ncbi:hypothetical protein [Acinetobacter sp.]
MGEIIQKRIEKMRERHDKLLTAEKQRADKSKVYVINLSSP